MDHKELRTGMSDGALVRIARSQGNRLQVILNALAVLKRSHTGHSNPELVEALDMACRAASQAGRLHRALLEHGFGAKMADENLDLDAALADMIALLRAANPSLRISRNPGSDLPGILVSRRILEQLVLSLVFAAGPTLEARALEMETSLSKLPGHFSGDGECLHIQLRSAAAENRHDRPGASGARSDSLAMPQLKPQASAVATVVAAHGYWWEISSDRDHLVLHLYLPATAALDETFP